MAEIKSFPNNQDVYIGAEHVMRWLHGRTSGVFAAGNNCAVEAVNGAMQVSVSDGIGWLTNIDGDGIVWWNSEEADNSEKLKLNIGMADGALPRIDRIIVSWVTTNNTELPTIQVLAGTPASAPVAPALTNNSTTRQISLARVNVPAGATAIRASMITDERLDSSVCGLVTESISLDSTVINNQWSALLIELQTALDNILEDHSIAASLVTYTNTSSGLSSTTVQNAVDELTALKFTNKAVASSAWSAVSTSASDYYADFPYKANITCSGVTANHFAEVVLNPVDAISGEIAPINQTGANKVTIYAARPVALTIPQIVAFK